MKKLLKLCKLLKKLEKVAGGKRVIVIGNGNIVGSNNKAGRIRITKK